MLLSFKGHSHCLFAPDRIGLLDSHGFVELKYKPYKRYIFNNQMEHMVVNFEEDRYILTLEFMDDKHKLSFENLLNEYEKK